MQLDHFLDADRLYHITVTLTEQEMIEIFHACSFRQTRKIPDQTAAKIEDKVVACTPPEIRKKIFERIIRPQPENLKLRRRRETPMKYKEFDALADSLEFIVKTMIATDAETKKTILKAADYLRMMIRENEELKDNLADIRTSAFSIFKGVPVMRSIPRTSPDECYALLETLQKLLPNEVNYHNIVNGYLFMLNAIADPDTAFLDWNPTIKKLMLDLQRKGK